MKSKLTVFLLIASLASITSAQDWNDSFNGTGGWIVLSGAYEITGGRLHSSTDGSHIQANAEWISNGTLELDVEFDGGLGLAVYFRWRDYENCVRCAISAGGFWVTEITNGTPVNVYQGSISGYHDPHPIRVNLQGYNYTVYLDDVSQYSGSWSYSDGGLMLESWGYPGSVDCYFDNVTFGNFNDNFTTYDRWYTLIGGHWLVENGRLASHTDGSQIIIYEFSQASDSDVDADLEFDGGLGLAMYFRYISSANCVRCAISAGGFWVTEITNGTPVNVYQGPITGYHDPHHVHVENRGNAYTVYLDGVSTYSGTWSAGTGNVMFEAWGYPGTVNCYVDNIIVHHPNSIHPIPNSKLPLKFNLGYPIPNPFNPQTQLTFSLPKAGDVLLIVYDVYGREVTRLHDGWLQTGVYLTNFDGTWLSTGIYFASLKTDGFSQTRKLLLLK